MDENSRPMSPTGFIVDGDSMRPTNFSSLKKMPEMSFSLQSWLLSEKRVQIDFLNDRVTKHVVPVTNKQAFLQ